ncbi:hypothetical protein FNV43_RR00516 [Rhamnella rubrinervis]|uniref:Uncharacterized protein n=1 Tax=Rhamnella rubrinervis TaxID=2594499 RepID=A0A8K0HPB8_9ROSA|nr:hypothetical protein FNV43_RR00516 [Rhamnella rubrinervis]
MVLKYFNLALGQLMPNGWRYLLGLIVLFEQLRQHIDMPIFLHFFYLKPGGEGRYAFYARKQTKLLTGAPTSDKGWKDRYFFIKKEGLTKLTLDLCSLESKRQTFHQHRAEQFDQHSTCSRKEPQPFTLRGSFRCGKCAIKEKNQESGPSQQQHKLQPEPILEGIPLPFIEVPYTHVLEGCIRLLYGEPTDPLWASYPTVDMGKMKVAAPTAEQLTEKERKRKEKKAARKASGSGPNKESEPTPGGMITIQPKDLRVTAAADKSPPHKKQRHSSPPVATKGKEPLAPKANLGLEDSSSIRSDSNLIAPIVDCLMTHHDKSILKSMPLEDICHEAEQGALKLAQTSRYLYEAVVKVDSAFKKKAAAHSSVVATKKILEEDILQFKQAAIDANAEEAEKNGAAIKTLKGELESPTRFRSPWKEMNGRLEAQLGHERKRLCTARELKMPICGPKRR